MSREPGASPGGIRVLGVDMGASGLRVHSILAGAPQQESRPWAIDAAQASRIWPECTRASATARFAACAADAIAEVSPAQLDQALLVGVAAPGRKSCDARSIQQALNMPALPGFLDALEGELLRAGLRLALPLDGLHSDAQAAAVGEQQAVIGSLRGTSCGLYLGGGSGLAECLLLNGEALAPEQLPADWQAAWSALSHATGPGEGESFEARIALRSLNAAAGGPIEAQLLAQAGKDVRRDAPHCAAAALLDAAVDATLELVARRQREVHVRWGNALERVVLGQAFAKLLASPTLARWRTRLEVGARTLEPLAGVQPRLLLSQFRAAPALGAAWLAARSHGAVL